MIKYSIIIPVYKHFEDCTKPCLESIIKNTNLSNVEVIVIANGCGDDETKEFVESLSDHFKLIWHDEPLGYTKATNIGISASVGEYVILLNNDCVLLDWQSENQWIEMLEKPFLDDPTTGISGPGVLLEQSIQKEFIIFFCAMTKRIFFNQLGLLDEIFNPGGGEDIDFSLKLQYAGYSIKQVPYKQDKWQYSTAFPIYHAAERTVFDLPDWEEIFKSHMNIISNRYKEKNNEL